MLRSSLFRRIFAVSLPIVFLSGTETLDHLINSAFAARLGVAELGAIGVADTLFFLFMVVPLALSNGIQIITARRTGEQNPSGVAAAFNQGLLLTSAASLLLTFGLKLASPYVTSDEVGRLVDDFLQIGAYAIVATSLTYAYCALLISLGRTWVLVPCTIILVVVNVVVNYLVVFGNHGFPALGIRGVALGFVLAEICGFVFLTVYLWLRVRSAELPLFRFGEFQWEAMALVSRISAPMGLQALLNTSRWLVFFLIVERLGTDSLAIANIVFTCYTVFSVPVSGFEETTCSMVGRLVGEKRTGGIGRVLRHATAATFLTTLPLGLIAIFAPGWILVPFLPEADLLGDSTAAVRIAALGMLICIPGALWASAVMGTGDTPAVLLIELVLSLAMIGMAYIAAVVLSWPVAFVWLSLPAAWAIALVLSYLWLRAGFWQRVRI
jgi:Na+-driven multidrug efflux pump